jgi:hypothetical protein
MFLTDLKHAARSLRRSPGFVIAAVATLALDRRQQRDFQRGQRVLMRPVAIPDPDRLVLSGNAMFRAHQETNVVNPQNYLDWQDRAKSFSGLAPAVLSQITFTGDSPEIISGRAVPQTSSM